MVMYNFRMELSSFTLVFSIFYEIFFIFDREMGYVY